MKQDAPERIEWIDACKGIGITAVVLGHNIEGSVAHFLFIFHVPLFFFLAGYLYKPTADSFSYMKRRAVRLLVPFLSFIFVFLPVVWICKGFSLQVPSQLGAYWFLPCLFLTQQIANLVLRSRSAVWVVGVVALALGCIRIPVFGCVVGALPFYLAGHMYKKVRTQLIWIALPGVLCAALLVNRQVHVWYVLKDGYCGVPIVSFLLALSCIIVMIRMSKSFHFPALEELGAASIGVYLIHGLVWMPHFLYRSGWISGLVALGISYCFTVLLFRYRTTRSFFFGITSPVVSHRVA